MKIGIDIDNVISNFNEELLKEYIKHDKELRNTGIINKNASYIRNGMFDWTEEEETSFYHSNIEEIAKNLNIISDASKYIKKIRELGNKIHIITGRDNGEYADPYNMTKDWLTKNDITYDELILTDAYKHVQKADICFKYDIDIMIDDSIHVCEECLKNGIKPLLFNTEYNKDEQRFKRGNTWLEIYDYIKNYKINVILDTDTANECDDQFAISYMIKSQDKFNIEAITIAPFSHKSIRKITVESGRELSYQEALKVCNFLDFNTDGKIFRGANGYIKDGYEEDNEAVNKIIEVALKNDKTYIMSIGAITNIALAIKKEPKIINKISVIWLGGNDLNYTDNLEFNFKQDVEAVRSVFDSKVRLTVIPCEGVASILKTDINTLKLNLNSELKLDKHLIDKFYNDGYHGIQETRIIWDISVIAYMINKNWFVEKEVSSPKINDDTSYELVESNRKITFIEKMDRDKIYEDLYKKLGD